ncbi:MAG TPA: dTDP-4-dehydrorhamnose reductase [Rickettsiales bacterium]|nr:dTDP-4-dehydrorhamnose reductase [Rickettsiales bacterium]
MNNLLVIGSTGQLARALRRLLPNAVFLGRGMLDLSKPETVREVLGNYAPSAVINAAAYTQVDNAEKEEALATAVNAESPAIMASWCAKKNIPFVSFSTDYVFDGSGDNARKEEDAVRPLNAYGRSKAESEKRIVEAGGKYLLFRTSWVYDASGKNFLNAILRLAGEREELRVINDQFGAPTFAAHLAKATLNALETALKQPSFPSGIYHLCNAGVTTWHGFASAIVEEARTHNVPLQVQRIQPIPATEYPLPAKRPANSRLDCSKAKAVLNITMPSWRDGVSECMKEKYENH